LLQTSLRLKSVVLNIRRRETVDAELLSDLDGIGGIRDFAAEVSGVKMQAQAGVTHGGRLGELWGTAGGKGSGIGAILTARADESRWDLGRLVELHEGLRSWRLVRGDNFPIDLLRVVDFFKEASACPQRHITKRG
jgi:hypothetical protein